MHDSVLGEICQRIGKLLEEIARARAYGVMSEPEFVAAVLRIESEEVVPNGFTLTASNTRDDWTVFEIRPNGSKEVCATFEFLPTTGEFRKPGSGAK